MKNYKFLFFILFLSVFPFLSNAQCREFTEKEAIPMLGDYILSGRYHSLKLTEGEKILIFKTLNRGIIYRFIVIGDKELPENIELKITDWNDKIIYHNVNDNYNKIFDYDNKKTQRIKIFIKVPIINKSDELKRGCVGLVIGIINNR